MSSRLSKICSVHTYVMPRAGRFILVESVPAFHSNFKAKAIGSLSAQGNKVAVKSLSIIKGGKNFNATTLYILFCLSISAL